MEINRKHSVPLSPSLYSFQFFEGYLEKKARNFLLGYQKRYFRCLEGKVLIYLEKKEDKQIKGQIEITSIKKLKSVDAKTFSFEYENVEYVLKAQSEQLKNKWIETLSILQMENMKQIEKKDSAISINDNKPSSIDFGINKKNKIINTLSVINKDTANIIKKYGYIFSKEESLSNQLLEIKGVSKLIKVNDKKIQIRMHYGIMYMKENANDSYNKRWFFLFSPRPLYNEYYNTYIIDLEQDKQKGWLKFDTLFYFKCDDNENSDYLGKIELADLHNILNSDRNNKFYINLDINDKVYDFYSETKVERDEWFEVIKNSRKTSKEYKLSITKHPRNVEILYSLYNQDQKEFLKKIQEEKLQNIGNCNNIDEFNIFEFTINNFQFLIESTIDGFFCSYPNKLEVVKLYVDHMIIEYLEIVKMYWNKQCKQLTNKEIIKLSYFLLDFGENLQLLNVDDRNLNKNGKELAKIYFNKNFQNISDIVENILAHERQKKGVKNAQGQYFTDGPNDIFDILNDAFNSIKQYRHPIIYRKLLKIFYITIIQYVIGVNCVVTNQDLIIEHEYLISVANSVFNLIQILNNLIDNMVKMNVLSEKEINEAVGMKRITKSINKLTFNAIYRFVFDRKDELSEEFDNVDFMDLQMMNVIMKTSQLFNVSKTMMTVPIVKRVWNEILKITLCFYISSLLLTDDKTDLDEIKSKLKNDYKLFFEAYESIVGEHFTKSTIKIINDIIDFFEVSQPLIVSSCLIIREFIGPAFSPLAAKKLIYLRKDLSHREKEESKKQCEEALRDFKGQKDGECSGYFNILNERISKIDKIKNFIKRLSEESNENINYLQQSVSIMNNVETIDFKDVGYNIEDEKKSNQMAMKINLADFLKDVSDEEDDNDPNKNKDKQNEINMNKDDDLNNIYFSVDHEGFLYKKSQFYRKYFFQLKNGYLYMYKDNISEVILNKYPLKNINAIENQDKKFTIKIAEEHKNKKYIRDYKFKCISEREKETWISAITKAMNKVKKEKIQEIKKIEIKEYKKIINDPFKLPNIKLDMQYMHNKVLNALENEDYFEKNPIFRMMSMSKKDEKGNNENEKNYDKKNEKKDDKKNETKKEKKSFGTKIKNIFNYIKKEFK